MLVRQHGIRGKMHGVIEELPLVVLEGEAGNFRGGKALLSFQKWFPKSSQGRDCSLISSLPDCNSADHVKSQDSQHTPHSMTPSNASAPRSSTPSHGLTAALEPASGQKTPSKVVYVFSTEMANK